MSKSLVFMFSGQGSQYYQMGKELYNEHPVFKEWMDKLDAMAYKLMGQSVVKQLYADNRRREEVFDQIIFTFPAVFMVEYSLVQVLKQEGIEPDYVLGSSMGEFASTAVSGMMDVNEVMACLIKLAQEVETHCKAGGMLAVIDKPELFQAYPELHKYSELASINYSSHFVISGSKENLDKVEKFLKEKGVLCQRLPVAYAFHSSHINSAQSGYVDFLKDKGFKGSKTPFVSCVDGGVKKQFPKDYFWQVTRQPMKFIEAFNELESKGEHIYLDLGPSGTLANFAKYNMDKKSSSEIHSIITPFGKDLKALTKFTEYFKTEHQAHINARRIKDNMIAYVFPGQGSQQKGMGAGLFDEFKELVAKADQILGYSIKELCLEDPKGVLGQTQYTQPALYVVNALTYLKKIKETGRKPGFVAGHSLGEYNALFAAEVFDFETGLKLVKKRGELMSQATGGGMAAVIGLKDEEIASILKENNLNSIDVANYNSPTQIVISGPKADVENAKAVFEAKGARNYVVLNVSGAFHSRYMSNSAKEFSQYLGQFTLSVPTIPVISNVYARPYKPADVANNMVGQITSSVKWTESVRYLMGKGEVQFEQIGPGTVLTGLIKTIQREAQPLIVNEEEENKVEPIASVEIKPVAANKTQPDNTKVKVESDKPAEEEAVTEKKAKKTPKKAAVVETTSVETVTKVETVKAKEEKVDIVEVNIDKKEITPNQVVTEKKQDKVNPKPVFSLGSDEFKKEYNLTHAYLAGSMYKGISSKEMVVKLGKSGLMGFFGSGGLELREIEDAIKYIQKELNNGQAYGMNLIYSSTDPHKEENMIDLYLKYGVRVIEASSFLSITPALVKYRVKGLKQNKNGEVVAANKVIAKVSRPEVAEAFLSPAPARIVEKLLKEGKITSEEAELSKKIPVASDLCAEADSGGNTDHAVSLALIPTMIRLRDEFMSRHAYTRKIMVGAAGGIGTPESAAAAFIMGADFIVTGSINQCTVEAGTSNSVKDLLQQINIQDTDFAPAGDMFELGAKVQVLKRGVFFPVRANKLYELYRNYESLNQIDEKVKEQLQEKYFKKSFDKVFEECKAIYPQSEIEKAEKSPKHKMALIFKWYFQYSTNLALTGDEAGKVDYQVMCGPALGAFNQWVKGTPLENWRNRHVDEIAKKLFKETEELLFKRFSFLVG